jgi:hypothetical protein
MKVDKEDIQDVFGLTPLQEGMLFHYLENSRSDLYFEQLCLEISGKIALATFKRAWNFVVASNEMLRAVFRWQHVRHPSQLILRQHRISVTSYDFSGLNHGRKEQWLNKIKRADRQNKFHLETVAFRITLLRLAADRHVMIISSHHIYYDGWSTGIILREFFDAFDAFSRGKEPLKPVKTPFKEFVRWLSHRDKKRQQLFWKEYLKDFVPASAPSPPGGENRGATDAERLDYCFRFPSDLSGAANHLVKERRVTLAALLYCTWGLLLYKYRQTRDILFGTTVSGRKAGLEGIEEIVGLFINTVPLRMRVRPDGEVLTLLLEVYRSLQVREEYESTSLVDIKRYGGINPRAGLFDSIVVVENYPLRRSLTGSGHLLTVTAYSMFEKANYDLNIVIDPGCPIAVKIIYNAAVYPVAAIKKIERHFQEILQQVVENSRCRPADITISHDLLPTTSKFCPQDYRDFGI